jgi:hypothetical protein
MEASSKHKRSESNKRSRFSALQLVVFVAVFAAIGAFIIMHSFAAGPATYYVSKTGSNAGGTSWATAFNELN